MRRTLFTLAALAAVATGAVAVAQDRGSERPFGREAGRDGGGWRRQPSPQDREAFTEARIAALHAGLRLNADQEKLWPPVEEALRGLARQRAEAREARRERWASFQAGDGRGGDGPVDIPAQLRFMSERQAASAEALKRMADASQPLYAVLDDGQKRRIAVLGRMMRPGGGPMGGREGGYRGEGGGYGPRGGYGYGDGRR